MTREMMSNIIETWGLVVVGTAAILEAIVVIGRRLGRNWPTISMVFRDDGKQWFVFPLGWGILAGHWWGPFPRFFSLDWIVIAGSIAIVLARDTANRWHPTPVSKKWTFAILLYGVGIGAVFWSSGA